MALVLDVKRTDAPDPRSEEEVFPNIDPEVEVLGDRVLVQLRRVKTMTNSGFYIPDETQQTLKFNETVAKVVQIGPLAYKNPDTLEPWPEGPWCKVGDIVRTIKYGGDRFVIDAGDGESPIIFITLQAREIISRAKTFEAAQRMKAFVE